MPLQGLYLVFPAKNLHKEDNTFSLLNAIGLMVYLESQLGRTQGLAFFSSPSHLSYFEA